MSSRMSAQEELRLVALARAGDREAEARLLKVHLPPAYALVNRYREHAAVPKEDLEQEAALAPEVRMQQHRHVQIIENRGCIARLHRFVEFDQALPACVLTLLARGFQGFELLLDGLEFGDARSELLLGGRKY